MKTIEDKGQKQIDALESLKTKQQTKSMEEIFPERNKSVEIKNELNKIKEYRKKLIGTISFIIQARNHMILECLKQFWLFGDDIHSSKITINEADQEQSDLVEYILNFNNKTRPK